MPALIDITGVRFGRLVAIKRIFKNFERPRWSCQCDCGERLVVRGTHLHSGNTQSCGCLKAEGNAATHGHARNRTTSRTYSSWRNMLTRCYNKKSNNWNDYGGRGISVCQRWRDTFANFFDDLGERPVGKFLDRINNDGNYEPGNVKWSTRKENNNNRRPRKRKTKPKA